MILDKQTWIWSNDQADEYDQYVYFRKTSTLPEGSTSARLHITAGTSYKAWINGNTLGRGPSPSAPEFQYFDTYTLPVGEGILTLAIEAYYLGNQIPFVCSQNQGIPGLVFCIEVLDCSDRVLATVGTEGTRVLRSPSHFRDYIKLGQSRISNWGGFKEVYDSAKEPESWHLPGFDDSDWAAARLVSDARQCYQNLVPRDIPFLKNSERSPIAIVEVQRQLGEVLHPEGLVGGSVPCRIDSSVAGSFPGVIVDFGREVVGYLRVTIEGFAGGNLSLWCGETLDLMRTDTLIMRGGAEAWEPYQRHAFRYVKISGNGCDAPIIVRTLHLQETGYPFKRSGSFESSSPRLNSIYETSLLTAELGTHDHFEDCPLREKSLWLGDARVVALVDYWSFSEAPIVRKCLRQFARIQRLDGGIPAVGPQRPDFLMVDYCAYYINMFYEYWFYTLDCDFLIEMRPVLDRLMAWFSTLEGPDGLLVLDGSPGIGSLIDWAQIDKRGAVTALNCLYYQALGHYAEICDLTGDPVTKELFQNKALTLRETIRKQFYNTEKGLFFDCRFEGTPSTSYSQQSNFIAAYTGVIDPVEVGPLVERLMADPKVETIKGAFLLNFVVDFLLESGFHALGSKMIDRFWGGMIDRGATTWWETFDPQSPCSSVPYTFSKNCPTSLVEYIPVSTCHAWGGGPAWILPKHVLGIVPLKPGFRQVRFRPGISFANSCRGTVPTPFGPIKVEWSIGDGGALTWVIEKPDEIEVIMD